MILSVILKSFGLMLVAKLLFGAGFEGMMMSKSIIINKWFYDNELSFAANLSLAFSREFVCVNGILTPRLA